MQINHSGVTICECWADLSEEAKMDVCAQRKPIMYALRELEQDPSDSFIGIYFLLKILIVN